MADVERTPKLTCGTLVLTATLALLVVFALHYHGQPPPWGATGAAAVAAVAVFVLVRSYHNFFWGLLAAAALTFHPSWSAYGEAPAEEILAGAVVLAGLASAALGWRLTFHPHVGWRSWPLVLGGCAICAGLAWKAERSLGLLMVLLSAVTFWSGAFLAARFRQRATTNVPARSNIYLGGAMVLLVPAAALVVFRFLDRALFNTGDWLEAARSALPESVSVSGHAVEATMAVWAWPVAEITVPLLLLALAMSGRRGYRQWTRNQTPGGWLPLVLALGMLGIVLVQPGQTGAGLALLLVSFTVMLAVSLVADSIGYVFERLVLLPPDERAPVAPPPLEAELEARAKATVAT